MAVEPAVENRPTSVEGSGDALRVLTVSPTTSTCRIGPVRSGNGGVVPFSTAPTTT